VALALIESGPAERAWAILASTSLSAKTACVVKPKKNIKKVLHNFLRCEGHISYLPLYK